MTLKLSHPKGKASEGKGLLPFGGASPISCRISYGLEKSLAYYCWWSQHQCVAFHGLGSEMVVVLVL